MRLFAVALCALVLGVFAQSYDELSHTVAPAGPLGNWYGRSVSISPTGELAVVGAPATDAGAVVNAGSAFVLDCTQLHVTGTCSDFDTLVAPDATFGLQLGWHVKVGTLGLSARTVVVGANNGGVTTPNEGSVYVWDCVGGVGCIYRDEFSAVGLAQNDQFGAAFDFSGSLLVVGGPNHLVSGQNNAGAVFPFNCPTRLDEEAVAPPSPPPGGSV